MTIEDGRTQSKSVDEQVDKTTAVRLGQSLVERGVFHHVLDEHPFRDGHFFYRFYADEPPASHLVKA